MEAPLLAEFSVVQALNFKGLISRVNHIDLSVYDLIQMM